MKQYVSDFLLVVTVSIVARASLNHYQDVLPLLDVSEIIASFAIATALLWSRWFWGLKGK